MEERKQEGNLLIYSLGTSQRSWEEFIQILERYSLKQIIDVRSFPVSKRYPHFSKENLSRGLREEGRVYFWLGKELGGYRRGGYEAYTKTEAFKRGLEELILLAQKAPSVIICAERFPWRCHRRFIAKALEEKGIEVIHIIDLDRLWRPKKRDQGFMFPLSQTDE